MSRRRETLVRVVAGAAFLVTVSLVVPAILLGHLATVLTAGSLPA